MKGNKKSEGTASSFLIAALLAIGVLVIIGATLANIAGKYSVNDIEYFDNYSKVKTGIDDVSHEYTADIDTNLNSTNTDEDTTEDNMFWKAMRIISHTPDVLISLKQGFSLLQSDLGIPNSFVKLVSAVLGVLLIALVVKIIRGFNNV